MNLAIFKSKPTYACSHHQNRYLLAEEYSDNSYFLPISFILPELIDIDLLQSSISAVIASEDSINIRFEKTSDIAFGYKKATSLPLSVLKKTAIPEKTEEQLISDFVYDGTGPLTGINCKVHFLKSRQGHTICTIALHHAVADALSLGFFMDRVSSIYNTGVEDPRSNETFTDLVQQLKLFSNSWPDSQRSFWIDTLANAGSETASLPLNLQPNEHAKTRNTVSIELTKAQFDFIKTSAKQIGVTTFEYVFSTYLFALKKLTTADAVCATFQSSGRRNSPLPDGLIGVFSNALPIFSKPKLEQPFDNFALEIREKVRAALKHEAIPYHEIIRLSNFHPQFGINWYPVKEKLVLNNHVIEGEHLVEWQSDFVLNLHCLATNDGLSLKLSYPIGKVATEHSSAILEHIQFLLLNTKQEDPTDFKLLQNINLPIFDVFPPFPEISEIKQGKDNFYDAFLSIVDQHPKQNAVIAGADYWQYSDLSKLIDNMAECLKKHGISAKSKVALRLDRGLPLIICIFALNKLNAIFSIYDTDYPEQRLSQMDAVFGPEWAICSDSMSSENTQSLHLKLNAEGLVLISYKKLVSDNVPESARYALFTSGTTGNPKCVLSSEKGLLTFIFSQIDQHNFGPHSHFALTGGLSHDPVLRDLLTPLLSGGSVAIPPDTFRNNPRLFTQWLYDLKINILHFTPQMSKLIVLSCEDKTLPDLRFLFWGGDLLKARDINDFLAIAPNAKAWNIYGATETPQASSIYPITPPFLWETCPIGMAVNSRSVQIINGGRQSGLYEVGEIVVSGSDLSLGYYDADKGLTPHSPTTDNSTSYSTGDLGFMTPSGDISIVGRLDNQIKIRGNRIEPKEIISLLESDLTVEQAVVSTKTGLGGETELIVYVERKPKFDLNKTSLFNLLKKRLPTYMIPHDIIILNHIPLTSNGKIDHKELASFASLHQPKEVFVPAETTLEKLVCEEISTLLSRPKTSVSSTVRELGVDSLSFLTVSMSLEKILGSLPSNWDELSLRELAQIKTKRSILKPVESPILMRALSIIAVVAGHFGILSFGGATSALFFIAGHSFGRFQAPAISSLDAIAPILKIIGLIALPTLIWTLTVQFAFGPLTPASWIFITNLIDPHLAQGMSAWFIEVLLQCLVILALLFSLPKARQLLRQYPYETALYFTLLAYILSGILSQFWDTSYLYNRVPQEKIWLMGLGWCLVSSTTLRQLQTTILLTTCIFGIEWFYYGIPQPITLATFFIVLSMQRVLLPFPINRIISLIASASLMIYLTQFQFKSIATKLPFPDSFQNSYVYLIFALLGGIILHYAWELFLQKSRQLMQVYTKNQERDDS